MLRHPCILGDPQCQLLGAKSEAVASPLHSRGPREGGNASSPLRSGGTSTKGNKIRSDYLTYAFSGAQKRAEMLRHPCILVDAQRRCPTPSLGSKIRSGFLTFALRGAQKRAEMLCQPCILGDPQRPPGGNCEMAASPLSSQGPKEGRNATSPLRSRGSPKLRAGRQLEVGASPLPSCSPVGETGVKQPLLYRPSPKILPARVASLIWARPQTPSLVAETGLKQPLLYRQGPVSETGLKQPLLYRQGPEIPVSPARVALYILSYLGTAPNSQSRRRDRPQTASVI